MVDLLALYSGVFDACGHCKAQETFGGNGMKKVRRGLVWLFMIWKRMFKKPGYVLLLLTIALLAISLSVFSQNSGSLVRIAIFADNEETKDVFLESENTTTVIKYEYFESEQSAYDAVTAQGYDAAWILTGDLFDAAREFTRNGEPIVKIFQREDTVFLRLSREKLYATIYPYISKAIYDGFTSRTASEELCRKCGYARRFR